MTSETDLLEREEDLRRIRALLEAAAAGETQTLLIQAPAGAGKTRLLDAARGSARGIGMRVLFATGTPLEQPWAFGVTRRLFEPLLDALDPRTVEDVLGGPALAARTVLGLGEGPASASVPADSIFGYMHALYWLTVKLTHHGPLALLIDDAHWADAPTVQFVANLVSRRERLPLAVALAARPAEETDAATVIQAMAGDPTVHVLGLTPLSREAVASLCRDRLPREPTPAFVAAAHALTGGNPFYLGQVLRQFADEGLEPDDDGAARLATLEPETIRRSVVAALSRHRSGAREIARALAVLGSDASVQDVARIAGVDVKQAAAAAGSLARAGILSDRHPLAFSHPIIASAVYAEIPAAELAIAHREAARMLASAGQPAERAAVHLMKLAPAGEAWAAEVLARAGGDALARGAADAAAALLDRAAAELPEVGSRPDVLVARIRAAAASLDPTFLPRAEGLLDALVGEPAALVRAAPDVAALGAASGDNRRGFAALVKAAEAVREHPERAAALEASIAIFASFDRRTLAMAAERMARNPQPAGRSRPERELLVAHAHIAVLGGAGADEVRRLLLRAVEDGLPVSPESAASVALSYLNMAGEEDLVDRLCSAALADARARGSAAALQMALLYRSEAHLRRGHVGEAMADARQAVDIVIEHASLAGFLWPSGFYGAAAIELGLVADALELYGRADISDGVPDSLLAFWPVFQRARAVAAEGRVGEAIGQLEELGRRMDAWGVVLPSIAWAAELARLLAACGDRGRAVELAERDLSYAQAWGTDDRLAVAERALGLAVGGEEGLDLLRSAVARVDGSASRLELTRSLVELGAALRRAKRSSEARGPLAAALDLATRCGATALAAAARAELRAAGARPRRILRSGVDALTPSERRICRLAADGRSNRQIAEMLFIGLRTVETHLTSSYRKLGITARAQLADALQQAPGEVGAAPPS